MIESDRACIVVSTSIFGNGTSQGSKRLPQYRKGICAFLCHLESLQRRDVEVVFVDNTCSDKQRYMSELNIEKLTTLPLILYDENKLGTLNKGSGVIEHWLKTRHIWSRYKWFIHTQGRQLLEDAEFLRDFFERPRALFAWNQGPGCKPIGPVDDEIRWAAAEYNGRGFFTGFFTISSSAMEAYLNSDLGDPVRIATKGQIRNLEDVLANWASRNLENFEIVDRVGVIRIDHQDKREPH